MSSAASSTKPRRLWLRILLGIVFVCVALGAVIALLLVVDRIRSRKAWEAYVEEARGRGQKLTIEEFAQPPVPDAQNFAAAPLFMELFQKEGDHSQVLRLPGKPPKLPGEEGEFNLDEWRQYFIAEKLLPPDSATADPAAMLQALDAHFGDQWQQIRVAASREASRFPVEWEKSFAALLPHLGVIQSAAKLSALRVQLQLAGKDAAAAYQEWMLGWRLAESLRKEAVLISFLVRVVAVQFSLDGVRAGIAAGAWDAATLLQIEEELRSAAILENYRFAVDSERGALNTFFDLVGSGEAGGALDEMRTEAAYRLMPAAFLHRNRLFANRYADESLARIDLEHGRLRQTPRIYDPEKLHRHFLQRQLYALVQLSLPIFDQVEKRALLAHTQVHAAMLACAIERYRLAQGDGAAYPESLEQLAPEFISRVPYDVMDGQPLRYRAKEDGTYIIYSIGSNGIDDGGATKLETSPAQQPDWIWKP